MIFNDDIICIAFLALYTVIIPQGHKLSLKWINHLIQLYLVTHIKYREN